MTDKEQVETERLCTDGLPAKVGETMYITDVADKSKEWTVLGIREDKVLLDCGEWFTWEWPEKLTHTKPEEKEAEMTCEPIEPKPMPKYYEMSQCTSIEFVDTVLDTLNENVPMTPKQIYSIKDALKYAIRAGEKGPWEDDAYKCADYLCRAIHGYFISEFTGVGSEEAYD